MNDRANFTRMQDSTQADWQTIATEFRPFSQSLPDRIIKHLKILEGDYGGFPVDRYTHSLQTATRALRDGRDEEYVVCALRQPEEWQLRCDLAACYRLVALYGWSDLVFTHISAKLRIPGVGEHHFLINPYGLMFDEITASSLVKVDMAVQQAARLALPGQPGRLHHPQRVHEARPDAGCVLHTHTRAGVAVSAQKGGVLPISQQSTFVLGSLAYHDYEGVAFRDDEKPRLQADLGAPTSSCCATTAC
jgi:ribulose-5-phosphate 4-epimerase/fuculose-1-phosphate aldolase